MTEPTKSILFAGTDDSGRVGILATERDLGVLLRALNCRHEVSFLDPLEQAEVELMIRDYSKLKQEAFG